MKKRGKSKVFHNQELKIYLEKLHVTYYPNLSQHQGNRMKTVPVATISRLDYSFWDELNGDFYDNDLDLGNGDIRALCNLFQKESVQKLTFVNIQTSYFGFVIKLLSKQSMRSRHHYHRYEWPHHEV